MKTGIICSPLLYLQLGLGSALTQPGVQADRTQGKALEREQYATEKIHKGIGGILILNLLCLLYSVPAS